MNHFWMIFGFSNTVFGNPIIDFWIDISLHKIATTTWEFFQYPVPLCATVLGTDP